jgi:gp16 family phage-associated protein
MSKKPTQPVQRLHSQGKTVAQWAKENGFPVHAVRSVIAGRNKGHYGQAHKIAVALGMKARQE